MSTKDLRIQDSKKIVVIGKGTAGAFSAMHFVKNAPNSEITWIYDPNTPTQAVGEGTTLVPIHSLSRNLKFKHGNLSEIDGTFKIGIYKENWGQNRESFMHNFPPPEVAYHFNALRLQDYVLNKLRQNSRVKLVEDNITSNNIDADIVIDCTGKPKNFDDFIIADYIPVNSVYVTQCFWDYPKFQYSLTNAMKHGWYFGIPLRNRCSIGYLYNNKITTLEEVKEDVKPVFEQYGLTPSDVTNSFSFNNYYRKNNFVDNIAYNGNASFFLEPLEATSIGTMVEICQYALGINSKFFSKMRVNEEYHNTLRGISEVIMLHYFSGSKFKTKFWDMAQEKAENLIRESLSAQRNNKFRKIILQALEETDLDLRIGDNIIQGYGTWGIHSFIENIRGLGINDKLRQYL